MLIAMTSFPNASSPSLHSSGNHGDDGPEFLLVDEQPHERASDHGQSDPGELLQQPDRPARGARDAVGPRPGCARPKTRNQPITVHKGREPLGFHPAFMCEDSLANL